LPLEGFGGGANDSGGSRAVASDRCWRSGHSLTDTAGLQSRMFHGGYLRIWGARQLRKLPGQEHFNFHSEKGFDEGKKKTSHPTRS